uniref:Ig-like domain-containing protein n=1 Tax=Sarcophilus harrisii TaxID=9305 RepID=A0A7N4NL05_SARHA
MGKSFYGRISQDSQDHTCQLQCSLLPICFPAFHRHEGQFIAVGETSLLDYTILHVIDDVNMCSYDKRDKQLVVKESWMSLALGEEFLKHKTQSDHRNITELIYKRNGILAICELDRDIEVKSQICIALDGEDFFQVDNQVDHWVFMHEALFWRDLRKHSMEQYCVTTMRKILQYSRMKDDVPPEVAVSHRDSLNGNITLSCLATGFYPRSIQLYWEKNGRLGVWGQERSSGILPNADATFYLQVTLEIPLRDTYTDYTCVVEHSALEKPVICPVPVKPIPTGIPWAKALGIPLAFILVLSCAGAFTAWKKKKTDVYVWRKEGKKSASQVQREKGKRERDHNE